MRDQLIRAVKYTTGANNVGSVEYEYCLSCDGALSPSPPALSHQREREPRCSAGTGSAAGALQSGRRYEYDGLNLLRVDQLYDSNSNGLTEDDAWRRLEVNTHGPGTLGALIGKRVYTHTNNDATPDATNDFTYTYDAVGNVIAVYNANSTNRGNEVYYFSQDAFGNELSSDGNLPTWQRVNLLGGSQWTTARTAGITEHQTGKWIDPFTGLYYFSARWYDSGAGRFVTRDPHSSYCSQRGSPYMMCYNSPLIWTDPHGLFPIKSCGPLIRRYLQPAQAGCFINARENIKEVGLSNCMERQCEEAQFECSNLPAECPCRSSFFNVGPRLAHTIHGNPEVSRILSEGGDNKPYIGKFFSGCVVKLCEHNLTGDSRTWSNPHWFSQKVIYHELGHCCGCAHWDMDGWEPEIRKGNQATGLCKGLTR